MHVTQLTWDRNIFSLNALIKENTETLAHAAILLPASFKYNRIPQLLWVRLHGVMPQTLAENEIQHSLYILRVLLVIMKSLFTEATH